MNWKRTLREAVSDAFNAGVTEGDLLTEVNDAIDDIYIESATVTE